ncbi:hypothetical protein GQ53DRAFT_156233 [Thozetella sp. PMI_491]|nr:hypothetical protein GQ53DRAFT_156233 [Thozetella sp. PMI_491]
MIASHLHVRPSLAPTTGAPFSHRSRPAAGMALKQTICRPFTRHSLPWARTRATIRCQWVPAPKHSIFRPLRSRRLAACVRGGRSGQDWTSPNWATGAPPPQEPPLLWALDAGDSQIPVSAVFPPSPWFSLTFLPFHAGPLPRGYRVQSPKTLHPPTRGATCKRESGSLRCLLP